MSKFFGRISNERNRSIHLVSKSTRRRRDLKVQATCDVGAGRRLLDDVYWTAVRTASASFNSNHRHASHAVRFMQRMELPSWKSVQLGWSLHHKLNLEPPS